MGILKLRTVMNQKMTSVSNRFLEEYMPRANGEFVKIYLLLLKACQNGEDNFSLPELADLLSCTEGDVIRAIRYWEKEGLLMLEMDADGDIAGLMLSVPGSSSDEVRPAEAISPAPKGSSLPEYSRPSGTLEAAGDVLFRPSEPTGEDACVTERASSPLSPKKPAAGKARKKLTLERQSELTEKTEISELIFCISQYLGHPLTKSELEKVLYFYDELHFSAELIEYLIEYCVENSHKSFRYIETVAFNWHEQGIGTVEEARLSVGRYQKKYFEVLNAFGISGRSPVPDEIHFIDTWTVTYGFSTDIIAEACSRTVMQTGNPSFPYANTILSNWHREKVASRKDIERLDNLHDQKTQENRQVRETPALRRTPRIPDYNRFDQRTYDYDDLKARLLKRKD